MIPWPIIKNSAGGPFGADVYRCSQYIGTNGDSVTESAEHTEYTLSQTPPLATGTAIKTADMVSMRHARGRQLDRHARSCKVYACSICWMANLRKPI